MRRADAGRIAWFLGLQRILRFPRYSMAPAAVVRPSRRSAAYFLDTPPKRKASFRSDAAARERLSHSAPQALSRVMRMTSVMGRLNPATILRHATGVPAASLTHRPLLQAHRDLRLTKIPKRDAQRYSAATPALTREAGAGEKHRPIVNPGGGNSPLRNAPALAPSRLHSALRGSGGIGVVTAPRLTAVETDGSFLGSGVFPPKEQGPSRPHTAGPPTDRSVDWDEGPERDVETRRSRPAVSTIHLDGSALGRWTIQHLERALGKPATGMTGVDPRATPPRSRVAPF